MTTLHFSISGDSLTNHVRELVLEGNWRHAVTTLVDGLDGMTHDLALAVLKGEKRLAGKDEDLHDEDEAAGVRATLQAQYDEALLANTLYWDGKYYRAYAMITRVGPNELFFAQRRYDEHGRRPYLRRGPVDFTEQEAFDVEKALGYANNLQSDIAFPVRDARQQFVTWLLLAEDSMASDLPLWMTPNTTVEQLAKDGRYNVPVRQYEEPKAVPSDMLHKPSDTLAGYPLTPVCEHTSGLTEEQLEGEYTKFVEGIRERVVAFANNDADYGWHEFKFHHEESGRYVTLKAPKRALTAFALSRTTASHLAPGYTPFSPVGMKMRVDNPLHTDVWLGCGLSLDDSVYDHDSLENAAFMEMMYEMQKALLGYEFHVLTSGGKQEVYGRIVGPDARGIEPEDILLVPHAGVEFDLQAREAGAVICEVGGKLAHLVTVCREDNKPIVRVPDAMKILRPGMRVTLDLQKGKLDIRPM